MKKYNWNYPTTMWVGNNRTEDLAIACKSLGISKPLLVIDNGLAKSEIVLNVVNKLEDGKFSVKLFSKVVGNHTGTNVDEGVKSFKENNILPNH